MKKIIFLVLCLVLLSSIVHAELNSTINIYTDNSNANVHVNPNTGNGTTTYYLDGTDFHDSMYKISSSVVDEHDILTTIYEIFMHRGYDDKGRRVWLETTYDDYKLSAQAKFRMVFDSIFVNWKDFNALFKQQNNRIQQLEFEIEALTIALNNEEMLCNGRLTVASKYNIDQVKCGNMTYYQHYGDFIAFNKNKIKGDINETSN